MGDADAAELRWLRYAAVLLSAALALGLLALTGTVTSLDARVAGKMQETHAGGLTTLFRAVGTVVSFRVGVLVAVAAALVPLARRQATTAAWTLTVMLGGWLIAAGLRQLVSRPRPPQGLLAQMSSGSYPSAHVAFAVGCALAAYGLAGHTRFRPFVVAAGTVTVSLVALSDLYLGAHYLSDVVGGILVSAAVAALLESVQPGRISPDRLPAWRRS